MKKIFLIALMGVSAASLAGCENTKNQFDFKKKAPDEFAVVRRAPLEIPANLNSLPPPRPGAARPQEAATDQMARRAVLGETAPQTASGNSVSAGEAALLQKTGGATASPAIRAKVDQETAEVIEDARPGIDKLKRMIGQTPSEPSKEAIDPVKEIERLRQSGVAGKPAAAPAAMDGTGSRKD